MEDNIFDITFELAGKKYTGWINPSDKTNDQGRPTSYHVVLNNTSLGYLSFNQCKWTINEDRPAELVNAVGKLIEKRYSL